MGCRPKANALPDLQQTEREMLEQLEAAPVKKGMSPEG